MVLCKATSLLWMTLLGLIIVKGVYAQGIEIKDVSFGFPEPAIPFYHIKMELELPRRSVIEVKVVVNKDTLRFTHLFSASIFKKIEIDKPAIIYRPPSAYALSPDNKVYKDIYIVSWWRWEPGKSYNIKADVTLKSTNQGEEKTLTLSASKQVLSPKEGETFSPKWKNYKALVVSETAGINRTNDPVDVLLPFYPDEATNIKNDIRVMEVNENNESLTEIPSQVYDIRQYLDEDDPERKVPFWYPTVTARLTFLADIPANTSRIFLVFYNNKDAKSPEYKTDLNAFVDDSMRMNVENHYFHAILSSKSRALDKIALASEPNAALYNQSETNGAIQWNPDIYSPPTPWAHTSDWLSPHTKVTKGPIVLKTNSWGNIEHYWGVVASVKYWFYAHEPYYLMTTNMRMTKTIDVLALRNAEMVFKRDLFDRVAWYDVFTHSIKTYDLNSLPDLTDLDMDNDVPWITFYNSKTGIGFAGIQLEHANSGIENDPRLLNPYFYVTVGPWVYWARGLSLSYISANPQQMIPALKGSDYFEKWAYLPFKVNTNNMSDPFAQIIDLQKNLTNPLKVHLVEEVDNRVTHTINEIMSNGKSPWDNNK